MHESFDTCSECCGYGFFPAVSFGSVLEFPCEQCVGVGERMPWDGTGDIWEETPYGFATECE